MVEKQRNIFSAHHYTAFPFLAVIDLEGVCQLNMSQTDFSDEKREQRERWLLDC